MSKIKELSKAINNVLIPSVVGLLLVTALFIITNFNDNSNLIIKIVGVVGIVICGFFMIRNINKYIKMKQLN